MKEAALRNMTLGGRDVTVRNYDQNGNYMPLDGRDDRVGRLVRISPDRRVHHPPVPIGQRRSPVASGCGEVWGLGQRVER